MTALVMPEEKQLQSLAWKFWQQVDFASLRSGIFWGVTRVLTELRLGQCVAGKDALLTDQETVQSFRKKLTTFKNVYGTEADEDLLRISHLIPEQAGINSEVFSWFVTQGEAGRAFFLEQQCDPEGFIKQADMDFAAALSQLQEWEAVRLLYQNFDIDSTEPRT